MGVSVSVSVGVSVECKRDNGGIKGEKVLVFVMMVAVVVVFG